MLSAVHISPLGLVLLRHWTNHCLQSKNSSQIQSKIIYTWLLLFFNSEQLILRKVQRITDTWFVMPQNKLLPIELEWTKKWTWFSLVLNASYKKEYKENYAQAFTETFLSSINKCLICFYLKLKKTEIVFCRTLQSQLLKPIKMQHLSCIL